MSEPIYSEVELTILRAAANLLDEAGARTTARMQWTGVQVGNNALARSGAYAEVAASAIRAALVRFESFTGHYCQPDDEQAGVEA